MKCQTRCADCTRLGYACHRHCLDTEKEPEGGWNLGPGKIWEEPKVVQKWADFGYVCPRGDTYVTTSINLDELPKGGYKPAEEEYFLGVSEHE